MRKKPLCASCIEARLMWRVLGGGTEKGEKHDSEKKGI